MTDFSIVIVNGSTVDLSGDSIRQVADAATGSSLEVLNDKGEIIGGVSANLWAFFGPKGFKVREKDEPTKQETKQKILELFPGDN